MKRGNLSKGPFKGKREDGTIALTNAHLATTHGDRVRALKNLDAVLVAIKDAMLDVVEIMNTVYPDTPVRGRLQSTGGCLAIRMVWRHGVKIYPTISAQADASFDLASPDGQALLCALNESIADDLIDVDTRRQHLNHHYRSLFNERKSLRRLHRYEQSLNVWLRERRTLKKGGP